MTRAEQRKKSIKEKIERLANKLVNVTSDIKRWGPKKSRRGLKVVYGERNGMIRHWEKMARVSLRATRKQIYLLQDEYKNL